jgi:phage-related protein
MGINTFSFDGVSSDTYGVYITEGASYNAPERAVEMLEIPGRNGHFALDQGRFENVEVTYHVFIDGSSETDYSANLSDLRNWLCSKVGYARLTDSYNPNEYRMAVYKSGLEVDGTSIQSGEFDVVFDCKPQRWLTSGETAVSVADGGTIDNPTLFPSSPLLAVKGYGNIDIGGQGIEVENVTYGEIVVGKESNFTTGTFQRTLDVSNVNMNDEITVNCSYTATYAGSPTTKYTASVSSVSGSGCTATVTGTSGVYVEMDTATFTKGLSNQSQSCSATYTVTARNTSTHATTTTSCTFSLNIAYSGGLKLTITASISPASATYTSVQKKGTLADVIANSTKSALGNPMYIDLDIGECWNEDSGEPVSVNNAVALGSDLPKLPTGQTTITYDNTVTELKVTPRWWKV